MRLNYEGVRAVMAAVMPPADEFPLLPMHFQNGETKLRLFTTIATLGTPRDITLQELRIESFFPVDQATRDTFREWGAGAEARGD